MSPVTPADVTRVRVRLPEMFDFDRLRRFLLLRRVPSLETWSGDAWARDTYVRSLWVEGTDARAVSRGNGHGGDDDAGQAVTLTIRHRGAGGAILRADAWLDVTCAPARPAATVRTLVTRMFDLDADLDAFAACVRRDRILGPLVRRQPSVRLPRLIDPFEGLVRAMLGQQVTVRAASTMTDRFVRRFGHRTTATPKETPKDAAARSDASPDGLFSFPRPAVIAGAGVDRLRTIGLTRAKAKAIARLAESIADGRLDCARLATLAADDAHAALLAVPGIGPWTASYVRMRVLGDRDAFPAADLGVIKALDALGVPRAEQLAAAERWRPWRAYATLHLWESLRED